MNKIQATLSSCFYHVKIFWLVTSLNPEDVRKGQDLIERNRPPTPEDRKPLLGPKPPKPKPSGSL